MWISIENISLVRDTLKKSETLNTELKTNFNNIINELNKICENVKSGDLSQANNEFTEYVSNIATDLNTNLDGVISFLSTQITEYDEINASTSEAINQTYNEITDIDTTGI